jgi:putative mRNA 3-end processing factor
MVRWLAEQGLQAGAFDTDYGGEDDDAPPEAPATTDPDRATGAEPGDDPGADPGADSGAHPAYPR